MRRALAIVILWLAVHPAMAQDPILRVAITPKTVSVGEPVELKITILVPTWFPQPPNFPSFEIANAIVRLPPNSSRSTSERIGRETWSGIVRKYQVYPLIGGTFKLTGLTMAVAYANPGAREPIRVDVPVPSIEIRAQVPSGAEDLDPYLAGRNLTLNLDVEGDTQSLQAGDALVLLYSAELDGLPAIFLPPLVGPLRIPGVSVYADEPVVQDNDRARRSEKITLVFETGGNFSIPEISIDWWNVEANAVETVLAPAVSLVVAGNALPMVEEEPATIRWQAITLPFLALLLILTALWRGLPAIFRKYRAFKNEQRNTEGYAFKKLRKTLRSGDASNGYEALLLWLNRIDPALDARRLAVRYGDLDFQAQVELLSRSLYLSRSDAVNFRKLDVGLVSARHNYLHACKKNNHYALPLMNP